MDTRLLPAPGENNIWYHVTATDTAIVFVHGVLSDSRSCWLFENASASSPPQYWPELIKSDARLGEPSLFLAGYYTAIDAGPYEVRNCADELYAALDRRDVMGHREVLAYPRLIFICHSTGGIVVRYLLDARSERFRSKDVGLVLIASPSYGSSYADRLDLLTRVYRHQLGQQLQWGSWSLQDLDARFKDLVHEKRIPRLVGVEAYENHFIVRRKWLPPRKVVVNALSAGRYFGAPRLLRQTDHFSCVKPDSLRHPAHELLVDFVTTQFVPAARSSHPAGRVLPPAAPTPRTRPDAKSAAAADDVPKEYEVIAQLYRGHYSLVWKCFSHSTNQVCVVKRTEAAMVSLRALQTLQHANPPGIVTPTRVWETDGFVWEELQWVDGTLLSKAVPRKVGGLRGSVLAHCHNSLLATLQDLHRANLIYRDVHPDNLFLVLTPTEKLRGAPDLNNERAQRMWAHLVDRRTGVLSEETVTAAVNFEVKSLLVDSSFVVLADEAQSYPPVVHGSYTPDEQAHQSPVFSSDIYALGATLFFGITGADVPKSIDANAQAEIREELEQRARHPAVDFGSYVATMLAPDPRHRPTSEPDLQYGTITPGYCGTLQLGADAFLISDMDGRYTHLVDAFQLLRFFELRQFKGDGAVWRALLTAEGRPDPT
jgi:serine/threonine protein kinase